MKKLFLTFTATLLLLSTFTYGQIPVKGLVAWYPFSGNANDFTDNNNNGTVNGAKLTTDRFGNPNSAYSFNGVNNYIEVSDNESLRGKNISISTWIKVNSFQTSSIISKLTYNTAENEQFYIGLKSDSVIQFSVKHNSNCKPSLGWLHNYNKDFSILNSWNHIGVTCSDTSTKIFLNGNLVSELKSNTQIDYCTGGNIFIGKNWLNDKRFFNGILDDIRIYNRALSQNEVTALYNENSCLNYISKIILPDYINTNGLVAFYPFNNDTKDYSGNQNDGVNNGAISTTDRFGNINKAYSFKDNTSINTSLIPKSNSSYTISIDFKSDSLSSQNLSNTSNNLLNGIGNCLISSDNPGVGGFAIGVTSKGLYTMSPSAFNNIQYNFIKNTWYKVGIVFDSTGSTDYYINGHFISSQKTPTYNNFVTSNFKIGYAGSNSWNLPFNGTIDNILIWNKALSKNELNVASNNTNCFSLISVTDTLKIGKVTGLNTFPDNFGLVKVYPNPAKDILNISVSNPTASYSIQITNQLGQVLYTNTLSNSSLQVNVNSLGANGLYFIKILDISNNVLDTRKLVLE